MLGPQAIAYLEVEPQCRLSDTIARQYDVVDGLALVRLTATLQFGFLPVLDRKGWVVYLDSDTGRITDEVARRVCRALLPHVALQSSGVLTSPWGSSHVTMTEPSNQPRE